MNKKLKETLYIIPFVILAFMISFVLLLISYPIHELGHASFATLSAMALHYPSTTLNFTYQKAFHYFNLPQRTAAILPTSPLFTIPYGLAGVFFTTLFYCLLFFSAMLLKTVRNNKRLQTFLTLALGILIIDSIFENLICGTDGLKFSCNPLVLTGVSLLFWFIFALLLSLSLITYVDLKQNKRKKKSPSSEEDG